jgi:hypothetical protein
MLSFLGRLCTSRHAVSRVPVCYHSFAPETVNELRAADLQQQSFLVRLCMGMLSSLHQQATQ